MAPDMKDKNRNEYPRFWSAFGKCSHNHNHNHNKIIIYYTISPLSSHFSDLLPSVLFVSFDFLFLRDERERKERKRKKRGVMRVEEREYRKKGEDRKGKEREAKDREALRWRGKPS